MSDINKESFSSLLIKLNLIVLELSRLSSLQTHYIASGNSLKIAQVQDSIKKLEMSQLAISLEIDRRMDERNGKSETPTKA